jgi:hypothetical protein
MSLQQVLRLAAISEVRPMDMVFHWAIVVKGDSNNLVA